MNAEKGAMTMKKLITAVTMTVALVQGAIAQESKPDWVTIFDGETLNGWTQLNGTATYEVVDATIVGQTAEGSPNSFLCTDRQYGDFELEFEVKCDKALNSGVQIRSLTKPNKDGTPNPKGRINGPQVEIECGPAQAGYIYGEATGLGWLSPEPKSKDQAVNRHSHFKNDDWNLYRVVANGPRIQTYINGQAIADLSHEETYKTHPKGVIGLQVHGIRKGSGPFKVAWRNIRIRELE